MPDESPILAIALRNEHDVVLTRRRAKSVAAALGFDLQEQTRLATAVSEIARNAFRYAGGGRVEFALSKREPPCLLVRVHDEGPGIADLSSVLDGAYVSRTGMGMGIVGARRLMDEFHIDTSPRGTTVQMSKCLPARGLAPPPTAAQVAAALAREPLGSPFEEMQQQNQELLNAMDELLRRQGEIERLNAELAETNRGVLALYAELDDKAAALANASELKSKFLSYMSHEFRTPLNAIRSMSRMLLDRLDGPLSAEQAKQVGFISKASDDLTALVNDLLDLARIEAGKFDVRPAPLPLEDLFAALRGMFRPLVSGDAVALVIEDPPEGVTLLTDEGKLGQVLRNLISNALKYTERGEVRVACELADQGRGVLFAVRDTGIGIALQDQERIFQEFGRIDSALSRRVRGTGLGLPLSRRLAELLGGRLWVESEVGRGSTFYVFLPTGGPSEAGHAAGRLVGASGRGEPS